jgi:hypothetical protein
MNITPLSTPEIKTIGTISVPDISKWTDLAQKKTKETTATVLDFSSHFRAKQGKTISSAPTILSITKPWDVLPEDITTELPNYIKHIFSKVENIDTIDPKIMEEIKKIMHVAAQFDVRAGKFGTYWPKDCNESFSVLFRKSLRPWFNQIFTPEEKDINHTANVNLGAIYSIIQDELLTRYGEIAIKNKDTFETTEKLEARLSTLKSFKNRWKTGWLDWAIQNSDRGVDNTGARNGLSIVGWTIPQRCEKIITLLFETFVEHYVEQVWELESASRNIPAEIAKSA